MSWNHRVIKKRFCSEFINEEWYEIHEVYYNKHGKVEGMTENAVYPGGRTIDELRSELEMMLKCLEKDVLDDVD